VVAVGGDVMEGNIRYPCVCGGHVRCAVLCVADWPDMRASSGAL